MTDIPTPDELEKEWQPIDTAPQDGREMLLRKPHPANGWTAWLGVLTPDCGATHWKPAGGWF